MLRWKRKLPEGRRALYLDQDAYFSRNGKLQGCFGQVFVLLSASLSPIAYLIVFNAAISFQLENQGRLMLRGTFSRRCGKDK